MTALRTSVGCVVNSGYSVRLVRLTGSEGATTELVPMLVSVVDGLPARLALRWVMRRRRWLAAEKTLSDDMRALGWLYTWTERDLGVAFDSHFGGVRLLRPPELQRLIRFLRHSSGENGAPRSAASTARLLARIGPFLAWLADVEERGGRTPLAPSELATYRERLSHNFAPMLRLQGVSERIPPLSTESDASLRALVGPLSISGRVQYPLRFRDENPWREKVRLRNWIALRLARELGLRRGAIGKLRIDDHKSDPTGRYLEIRRRTGDIADSRGSTNRPSVKTIEYAVPISMLLSRAIAQYEMTRLDFGGRRGARSPYLLVTERGGPISGTSLDSVWTAVRRRMPSVRLSWHVLRHTWAEETAEFLLAREESEETALAILRKLGGWTAQSHTPLRYISNVLQRRGDAYLRQKNAHFDEAQS